MLFQVLYSDTLRILTCELSLLQVQRKTDALCEVI